MAYAKERFLSKRASQKATKRIAQILIANQDIRECTGIFLTDSHGHALNVQKAFTSQKAEIFPVYHAMVSLVSQIKNRQDAKTL